MRIGKRTIGSGNPVYIIAEIGSNHDGSLKRAKELIRAVSTTGADCVKFQAFRAETLLNRLVPGKDGVWQPNPAYEVIERLTIPRNWYPELIEYAALVGVDILFTVFDEEGVEFLSGLGVEAFKIASGDVTNIPLLKKVAQKGLPVILSTGASYMEEVEKAVCTLKSEGLEDIALMHCVSLYPPKPEDMNLRCIESLKERFSLPVGFSDHATEPTFTLSAVSLGASIIEKHITLNRTLKGPDHPFAMEVDEFSRMVQDIRAIERALGDGLKKPSEREIPERVGARRSIYLKRAVRKGTTITRDMLKVVRQAYGMMPEEIDTVVGRVALKDLSADMPLRKEELR